MLKQPVPEYISGSAAADTQHSVVTPMPSKISQVNVKPGQAVTKGQALVILEAMKMEVCSLCHIML